MTAGLPNLDVVGALLFLTAYCDSRLILRGFLAFQLILLLSPIYERIIRANVIYYSAHQYIH